MSSDRIIATKEIAVRLGCSTDTIRRLFRSKGLPGAFKTSGQGSPIKISEADLQKFIRGGGRGR